MENVFVAKTSLKQVFRYPYKFKYSFDVTFSYPYNKYSLGAHSVSSLSRISQNSTRYVIFAINPFLRGSK
jgi:hypothetical protein